MARPRKEIDKEQFEKLCSIQATLEEISNWFNISEDTIQRWCNREYNDNFAVVYKNKSANGKISLRRKMFEIALKGDKSMLIWLSKQHLGMHEPHQTENQDIEIEDVSIVEQDIYD